MSARAQADAMTQYSFCETLAAIKWHVRPLTTTGQKFSGGADTRTLCGLKASWDIKAPITSQVLETSCFKCWQLYRLTETRRNV